MAKEKRPVWFKVYYHQRAIIDAMPDEVVGRALKASMHYFDTGNMLQLGPLEMAVFSTFRPFIDEAIQEYKTQVENGKKSANARKSLKGSLPPSTPLREEEIEEEVEVEEEIEKESNLPPKAANHSPFIPPTLNQVTQYCKSHSYRIDPGRFINYYESIGWKVGKSPMKDWKAALRNWNNSENKKEKTNGKTNPTQNWTVGTVL